ncbi:MAG: chemotaxis response regulator protein-glutamate methylesterase [Gammaproteobacteria bacterium]|nr:chemotaxis response regulator protein-glutamate methylesterase [Gammaproteobacteria bacterium]
MSSKVRVLVVDDSSFFQQLICGMLSSEPRIEVVGRAADGLSAVKEVHRLEPDVVTMDVEMPVMDGITAVRRIMEERPTPIVMFSAVTREGAKATLDALDAGAVDFLQKLPVGADESNELAKRVLMVSSKERAPARPPVAPVRPQKKEVAPPRKGKYQLVAIGASTGGPAAVQKLLSELPASFSLPVLVIVHMPGSFTPAYAQRLNAQCKVRVKEAVDGDVLRPGQVYLAPGGKQMLLERRGRDTVIKVIEGQASQTYKPSVDISFGSAAGIFSSGVLAVVLTGMGADGRQGARLLKQGGSSIWSQDESSCVVYGMPQAVEKAGLSDRVLPLGEIGPLLGKLV